MPLQKTFPPELSNLPKAATKRHGTFLLGVSADKKASMNAKHKCKKLSKKRKADRVHDVSSKAEHLMYTHAYYIGKTLSTYP
jgi:hypothetical protein